MAESLKLLPDEEIVKRAGKTGLQNSELILTNKNLIEGKRNLFGKVKEYAYYPLSEIRLVNGQPQVKVGKPDFMKYSLDVYFNASQASFAFSWEDEAQEWADSIVEVIAGRKVERNEFAWLEGTLAMAESVTGTISKMKRAVGIREAESCACPGCGAPITGFTGETTQCPYCGKYHTF